MKQGSIQAHQVMKFITQLTNIILQLVLARRPFLHSPLLEVRSMQAGGILTLVPIHHLALIVQQQAQTVFCRMESAPDITLELILGLAMKEEYQKLDSIL